MADSPAAVPAAAAPPGAAASRGSRDAILFVLLATVFFCGGDIAAKALSETVPATQIALLRYAVFAAMAVPVAAAMLGRRALATGRPGLQAARGAAVVGSTVFFISGLAFLDVPEATAINFVSPILMMALSIPLLGERVGWRRWSAAAVGFAGVLVVMQPGTSAFTAAALLPVAAAACWALSSVLARMLGAERPETTMSWSALAGVVALAPMMPFVWHSLDGRELALALVLGILSTAGNWLVLLALRLAPASVLAPFFYAQILSASALSWAILGQPPSAATMAGGAIIAASGVYVAYRARRKATST